MNENQPSEGADIQMSIESPPAPAPAPQISWRLLGLEALVLIAIVVVFQCAFCWYRDGTPDPRCAFNLHGYTVTHSDRGSQIGEMYTYCRYDPGIARMEEISGIN